jgi:hypothetical protein
LLTFAAPLLLGAAPPALAGDLFTPAPHLWVTAGPDFHPVIRCYRLADFDHDGYAEYAVFGASDAGILGPGRLRIMDGRSGAIRREWIGKPQPTNGPYPVNKGDDFGKYGVAADLDGDGLVEEAVIGAHNAIMFTPVSHGGRVEVRSWNARGPLFEYAPTFGGGGNIGVPIERVGDITGDGADEVIVGAPSTSGNFGLVRVLSGMNLTTVYEYPGWHPGQLFGTAFSGGHDLDGDGVPDFIIGGYRTFVPPYLIQAGIARIHSGATGQVIRIHSGTASYMNRGADVAFLGDVTGDGIPDYVIEDAYSYPAFPSSGSDLRWYDGASGTSLFLVNGIGGIYEIDALSDVTGDGIPDLLVGASGTDYSSWQGNGRLTVLSGASATIEFEAVMNPTGVGWMYVSGLGDVDGDGVEDIGAFSGATYGGYVGQIQVFTSTNLEVTGSLAPGGTATFEVHAPARAGLPFRIALSQGTVGFTLGPWHVPLDPDWLFFQTAANLAGSLDASGQGSIALPIPPEPSLVGLLLHGSGLVLDAAAPFPVVLVLNRVEVEIG